MVTGMCSVRVVKVNIHTPRITSAIIPIAARDLGKNTQNLDSPLTI